MNTVSSLMQVQPFIQAYALAVSSILGTAVTVVDSDLVRVGGTGNYAGKIGQKINQTAFFADVLASGKPGFIKNSKRAGCCSECQNRDSCAELANMAYPIFLGSQVVGVVGIIAFNQSEWQKLLRDQEKLHEFLKYMCMLIESKLLTQRHSHELEQQIDEVISLDKKSLEETPFLGHSRVIRDILTLVEKISASGSTVLLSGESGTGKEVIARYIHNLSPRGSRLMTSINCGAIPESLVESELFGYEEGAFTGAKRGGQMGKFELADKSTLFLDEIGEMPLPVQTKLLRVLQERTVQRLGGKKSVAIDVRIICATNKDLKRQVDEGTFRDDLFYRLSVIPIALPPLRERREDIPLFIDHFVARYNQLLKKNIRGLDKGALDAFLSYDWPGNVRELRNLIEYLANIVDGETICMFDLPDHFLIKAHRQPARKSLKAMMDEHEKLLLSQRIVKADSASAKKDLAKQLGISNATLYRKLAVHGLLQG